MDRSEKKFTYPSLVFSMFKVRVSFSNRNIKKEFPMSDGRLIYGSSGDTPDIFYASGFMCIDPFIYFSCGNIKAVVVPALEHGRALKEVKNGIRVFERRELLVKSAKGESLKDVISGILKKYSPDTWLVPGNASYAIVRHMQDEGASVKVVENDFFPERRIKTQEEIKNISSAQKTAEKAMLKAYEILAESSVDNKKRLIYNGNLLSSEFLRRQINILIVGDGGNAFQTIVSSGKDSSDPHCKGHGPIKADSPIVIDIFPKMEECGYWGDITRTFVKGKAPAIVKKAYLAVKEARDCSKAEIRTGALPSKISEKALEILESHGFKTGNNKHGNFGFIHSLGHGIGLDIHENPRVSIKNETPLEKGNVITVEPGLYYPEWGGIRLEDIVVVGDKTSRTLTSFPSELEI